MRSFLLVCIVCIASDASGNAIDSGKCPWKLPFQITVTGHGKGYTHEWNQPTHKWAGTYDTVVSASPTATLFSGVGPSHDTIYTAFGDTIRDVGNYWIDGHTLHYLWVSNAIGPSPSLDSEIVVIRFASGADSILSLTCHRTHWDAPSFQPMAEEYAFTFQASGFSMNDTSIYTSDSSMKGHNMLFEYSASTELYTESPQYPMYGDFTQSSLDVTDIDVSGIFQSTHFSNIASSVKYILPQRPKLSIFTERDRLHCSFLPSSNSRSLEVFSIVGSQVAAARIDANQDEAVVPHIPHGYYFVRLGNAMTSIYVAE